MRSLEELYALKNSPLYQTQQQVKDIVDRELEMHFKQKEHQFKLDEIKQRTQDRIQAEKQAEQNLMLTKKTYVQNRWMLILTVVGIVIATVIGLLAIFIDRIIRYLH